jgi:hypothetical protein
MGFRGGPCPKASSARGLEKGSSVQLLTLLLATTFLGRSGPCGCLGNWMQRPVRNRWSKGVFVTQPPDVGCAHRLWDALLGWKRVAGVAGSTGVVLLAICWGAVRRWRTCRGEDVSDRYAARRQCPAFGPRLIAARPWPSAACLSAHVRAGVSIRSLYVHTLAQIYGAHPSAASYRAYTETPSFHLPQRPTCAMHRFCSWLSLVAPSYHLLPMCGAKRSLRTFTLCALPRRQRPSFRSEHCSPCRRYLYAYKYERRLEYK